MAGYEVIDIPGGLSIEIMVSSKSSNNTCCVFIETTPPGAGPPFHKHVREEEVFTVLSGEYQFYRDGTWETMDVGVPVISLRDTYHAFRNVGALPGRIMLMTNGGGIDDYFRSIAKLRMPEDAEKLNEISSYFGYFYMPVT